MAKKIVALLCVVTVLFSVCAVTASAASNVTISAKNGTDYCTCTLTGKKTAYVTVKVNCGGKPTVTFKDERGRYIWGENKAIGNTGSRKFKLGSDHKIYRIYVKDSKPRFMQGSWAYFSKPKNCTIN